MARLPDPGVVGPFGALLDTIRGMMTITEFAEKCGVGQTDVTKYRKGGLPTPGNFAEMKKRPILAPHARELDRAYADRAKQQAEESTRAFDSSDESPAAELANEIMATAPESAQAQFLNMLSALRDMVALKHRAELSAFTYLADMANTALKRSKQRPDHSATWRSTPPEEASA